MHRGDRGLHLVGPRPPATQATPHQLLSLRDQPAWLELHLIAGDLLAWTQTTLLGGELPQPDPLLRDKLLHAAARITRGQRRVFVRIDAGWPWRHAPAAASARLQALLLPAT